MTINIFCGAYGIQKLYEHLIEVLLDWDVDDDHPEFVSLRGLLAVFFKGVRAKVKQGLDEHVSQDICSRQVRKLIAWIGAAGGI